LKIALIIPVYNEEAYLDLMLSSLVNQTKKPTHVVIVDDNSTDNSPNIIKEYTNTYPWISSIKTTSSSKHSPGSKVIQAFYKGYETLKEDLDLIGKFDADIILPTNYIEKTVALFQTDAAIGIAGGNLYIEKNGSWVYENISEKTKVRGPIKLYRKACFEAIGGLKKSIGWDSVDVLLAAFRGWKTSTDPSLHVKHLKITGKAYSTEAKYKQGEAFYRMRYGKSLTRIAALKLAMAKKDILLYTNCMRGYYLSKKEELAFIVTEEEGVFIRNLRWEGIKKKILYRAVNT
jgi:glycosyltransferase involved in cell wall biosynthesis